MKTKKIIPITLINLIIIVSVMVVVGLLTQSIMRELKDKDIKNITRLTETSIYADITREFTEPINTSLIMSQNVLLHDFMNEDNHITEEKMAEYLSAVRDVTGYDSHFLVPHSSLSYYHPGGTDAKVDLEDDSSFWYKAHKDSNEKYTLVVNNEQLDNGELYLYIDATIEDENGEFAGVTGVGKRVRHLGDMFDEYMNRQGVDAYLVDANGVIQVHRNEELIKQQTVFELENVSSHDFRFLEDAKTTKEMSLGQRFIITHKLPMVDWYLIVTKKTSELESDFTAYSVRMYLSLTLAVLLMLIGTSLTIRRYKQQIVHLSNTDYLTGIPNRTIFERTLEKAIRNRVDKVFCLALFDVDNLKTINDELGHDKGDFVLERIATFAKESMMPSSVVSRIGGDEFGIIIYLPIQEAKQFLEQLREVINEDEELNKYNATISVGITELKSDDTESLIYKRADEALYQSKESGKNKVEDK